ncbi:hypothetical protein [uncultured Roseobacter sp.]|uniref:hypothetical protein n=1 Tax=uncultured Roseobacter sp. TaxID=114847 RepID=UPI002625CFC0|nr:hypothetical protein [uncultured Roseobacter sp.]
MPAAYLAADLRIADLDEAYRVIREIADVGLIKHDPDEDIVAICNWFEFNEIGSRKTLAGYLKSVGELPVMSPIRTHTLFGISAAMIARVASWNKIENRADALNMLAAALVEHRAQIGVTSWEAAFSDLPPESQEALNISLPIDLPIGVSKAIPIQRDKIEIEKETKTESEIETENKTGDPQQIIAALNRSAKGGRR